MGFWDTLQQQFTRAPKGSIDQGAFNLPGFDEQYGQYSDIAGQGPRGVPQVGQSQFRGGQYDLVRMLQEQAAGRGPGQELVRRQAQGMADRGMAQQLAAARGARPGMGAAGFMGAAQNAANMQSRVGEQAAMGGLQAQLGATGQLGGVLQGARGQDIQRGGMNAQLGLQSRGMDDARQMQALQQRLMAAQMQQGGQMGYQGMELQRLMGQPTMGERLLGLGVGAASMYMGMPPGQPDWMSARSARGPAQHYGTRYPGQTPGFAGSPAVGPMGDHNYYGGGGQYA